jgi:hypothetical protein
MCLPLTVFRSVFTPSRSRRAVLLPLSAAFKSALAEIEA